MFAIVPPTSCNSCGSELVWEDALLYCHNPNCGAKNSKEIEHFAKTLKIKGLGPAAIDKLGFSCPSHIYLLSEDDISALLGSEKLAAKLYAEITNSALAPLELVLPAFGIPLIGKTATGKLSDTCETITDINADTCARAGLGPKATENLLNWLRKDFYGYFDGQMPFDYKFSKRQSSPPKNLGVVCISGRLKSFKSKADANEALTVAGYEIASSLTKKVTILVNESGIESAKTKQARDSGIIIITNLNSFLET